MRPCRGGSIFRHPRRRYSLDRVSIVVKLTVRILKKLKFNEPMKKICELQRPNLAKK